MKSYFRILVLMIIFVNFQSFGQVKNSKDLKAEKKLQKQKEVEALIDSKNFIFSAKRVSPLGYRNIDLDYNTYFINFTPDRINCDLPYFGRAYSVNYGTDGGVKFEGKPENSLTEKKKKLYTITMEVRGKNDFYKLFVSIYFNGSATVMITSNNRAPISYDGEVIAPKNKSVEQ